MTQFRKKPVVIEAKQASGTPESNREIIDWTRGSATPAFMDTEVRNCSADHPDGFDYPVLKINTLEGTMTVAHGDWVIKGVKGEFYPCKRDIFELTYDAAPADLEQEIQAEANKGPSVTPAALQAEIVSEHYFTAFDGVAGAAYNEASPDGVLRPFSFTAQGALGLLTFCVLVLRNGAKVVGVNYGAIDPAQHSAERGRQEARSQAEDKVYELLGFLLRDELARPVLTDADAAADLAGTPRPT